MVKCCWSYIFKYDKVLCFKFYLCFSSATYNITKYTTFLWHGKQKKKEINKFKAEISCQGIDSTVVQLVVVFFLIVLNLVIDTSPTMTVKLLYYF